jgi:hypothetical protein
MKMSTTEYEVLDELYFIRSFEDLKSALGWEEEALSTILQALYRKGWIRCFEGPVHEISANDVNLKEDYDRYHYLASKEGLIEHNS